MKFGEPDIVAVLREKRPIAEICRAAGIAEAEFTEARDAWLRTRAAPADRVVSAKVGGRVEILRDRAGVPHVFADATSDLYFGLGVAMAEDRLWQMDRLRRRALGRQAEILGAAYLASDIAHRTIDLPAIAAREAEAMDPASRAIAEALVAGINRQIALAETSLPVEFLVLDYTPEPFTLVDLVAIARGIWWSLNGRIDRIAAAETARLLPDAALRTLFLTPEGSEHLILPDGGDRPPHPAGTDDATGSNNWALGPERTGTGAPILCGDPHQPFWVPSSWYEFGLHGPEDDAAGAGHPGLPGMWWGSNGTLAWSITNNAASTRDLYREEVDPHDVSRYREGDGWRNFETREESIAVRGAAPHALAVRETVRGPIINALIPPVTEGGDPPLSLRWVGAEHIDDFRAMIGVHRAQDRDGIRAALRDWSIAVFNFVYADRSGNVGYQMAGRVPIRGRVTGGFRDASNPADAWRGAIPYDALPQSFNPARGYVASANQRVVPPNFPVPIYGAYSQGHRGARIDLAFAPPGNLDRAANIAFQNDVKNMRAVGLVPHILRHLAASGAADAGDFAALLEGWDGDYTLESPAPVAFEGFMARWQRVVQAVHLPERLLPLSVQQTGLGVALLEGKQPEYFPEGVAAKVAEVARWTLAGLRERLGADQAAWRWGDVHLAHWKHPASQPATEAAFDVGPAPVDGGSHTVRNTGGELPPHGASSGAEYRIVVDFTAPERFLAVQNIGNSGVPGSPHYRDQFEPWLRGEYHVVALTRDGVEADCESRTIINPG